MMEEDPLIPLVHMWSNSVFDHAPADTATEGDKENHRPEPDADAEIERIEAEILRLSSRLHHLRCARQPEPERAAARPLDVAAVNPNPLADKQQHQRKRRPAWGQPVDPLLAPLGRGLSLGPLDIAAAAANDRVRAAASPQRKLLRGEGAAAPPVKEPPVQRRRSISLGPLEIHRGVNKPAAARVKTLPKSLGSVREGGQNSKQHAVLAKTRPSSSARQAPDAKQGTIASRAKARSGSMSPSRSRRQSTSKVTETRGGNAKATETRRGSNAAVGASKTVGEVKAKGVMDHTLNGGTGRRPAGSSKVKVVPSRYSLTACSSLGAGTQEKQRNQSRPGSAGGASRREDIKAKLTKSSDDVLSPETIAKVAGLLPRIRTIPPVDETPRDSGCAKRVADLVGKQSFFTAAVDDGNAITPYQARVLEVESPEATAEEEA